jgi:hypothetical protein
MKYENVRTKPKLWELADAWLGVVVEQHTLFAWASTVKIR